MNKFNSNRFVDILKKEWSEYFRAYGISLIVWSCIPVLLWIATLVFGNQIDADSRGVFVCWIVFLAMMNVPEKVYGKVNLQREGVAYSMLPATAGEKFFSMMIYCSIVTPALVFAGCMLMDFLMYLMPFGGFVGTIAFPSDFGGIIFIVLSMLIVSSVFMFGNMIFKKRKAGKTVAWIFLIVFVLVNVISLIFNDLVSVDFEIQLIDEWVINLTLAMIAAGFYFGTYRKIKTQKY